MDRERGYESESELAADHEAASQVVRNDATVAEEEQTRELAVRLGSLPDLIAAFDSPDPDRIADVVNDVEQKRLAANLPADDSWETTRDLFGSPSNARHLIESIADAEAYLRSTGQTLIEGPVTSA